MSIDDEIETLLWLCESRTFKPEKKQFEDYHDWIVDKMSKYSGDRFEEFKSRLFKIEDKYVRNYKRGL